MSNVLRRLMVNRELIQIGAPRVGKLHFLIPDHSAFLSEIKGSDVVLFQSGCAWLFPMLEGFAITVDKTTQATGKANFTMPMKDTHVSKSQFVRIDGYLAQRALCFRGKWATRKDIIKFAAICGSGVHSEVPNRPIDRAVAKARNALLLTKENGNPAINLNIDALGNFLDFNADPDELSFKYDPHRIDVVLAELFAAAYYLCASPDVEKLEKSIRKELGV